MEAALAIVFGGLTGAVLWYLSNDGKERDRKTDQLIRENARLTADLAFADREVDNAKAQAERANKRTERWKRMAGMWEAQARSYLEETRLVCEPSPSSPSE